MNWKEVVKQDDRYKSFTLLDNPKPFNVLYDGQDIDYVQVHSIQTYTYKEETTKEKTAIVGFCGAFLWKNNQIVSIDNDTYNPDMIIYGYDWFDYKGDKALDILVGDDW